MAEQTEPQTGNTDPGPESAPATIPAATGRIVVKGIGDFTEDELSQRVLATHDLTRREQVLLAEKENVRKQQDELTKIYTSNKQILDLIAQKPELMSAIVAGDADAIRDSVTPAAEFLKHLEQLRIDGSEHYAPLNSLFSELSKATGEITALRQELSESGSKYETLRDLELGKQLAAAVVRFENMPHGDHKLDTDKILAEAKKRELTPDVVWKIVSDEHLDIILADKFVKGVEAGKKKKEAIESMQQVPGKPQSVVAPLPKGTVQTWEERQADILEEWYKKHPDRRPT